METSIDEKVIRIISVIADVSPDVVRQYFRKYILEANKQSFEDYLNKNKHILFHLYSKNRCCACMSYPKITRCNLSPTQFSLLFDNNGDRQHNNSKEECLCRYKPLENESMRGIDITLTCIMLTNCEENIDESNKKHLQGIKDVRDVRNQICHSLETPLSNKEFEEHWNKLYASLTGLANTINKNYTRQIKKKMHNIRRRTMCWNDVPKVWILHKDVLREQKCYIKNMQHVYFNCLDHPDYENIDHREKSDERQKVVETNCGEVRCRLRYDKKTYGYASNEDEEICSEKGHRKNDEPETQISTKSKLMVPALLYLEIPNDLDKKQLNTALKQLQTMFNATDSNLKIHTFSTDEMKILLNITRHLLKKVNAFEAELSSLMTKIIETSGVDTSKQQTISATVQILNKKESKPLELDKVITNVSSAEMSDTTISVPYNKQQTNINGHSPIDDYFKKKLKDCSCIEGANITFTCESLEENVQAKWFYGKNQILENDKYGIKSNGKHHELKVYDTSMSDAGQYSVSIKGYLNAATLHVTAYFIKELEKITSKEGCDASFICEVIEDNLPAQWSHGEIMIVQSKKHHIKSIGRQHELTISNVDMNDNGEYWVAINDRTSVARLTVQGAESTLSTEDQIQKLSEKGVMIEPSLLPNKQKEEQINQEPSLLLNEQKEKQRNEGAESTLCTEDQIQKLSEKGAESTLSTEDQIQNLWDKVIEAYLCANEQTKEQRNQDQRQEIFRRLKKEGFSMNSDEEQQRRRRHKDEEQEQQKRQKVAEEKRRPAFQGPLEAEMCMKALQVLAAGEKRQRAEEEKRRRRQEAEEERKQRAEAETMRRWIAEEKERRQKEEEKERRQKEEAEEERKQRAEAEAERRRREDECLIL